MATFHIPISLENTAGSSNLKVKFRLMGDPVWSANIISSSSGTTYTLSGLQNNRIYEIQVQNLNGAGNDLSLISQQMGLIFEEDPTISPTGDSVGYSFDNLSEDIDQYTVQLTTVEMPGNVIATAIIPTSGFPAVISGSFSNLDEATAYRLLITPVANQFSKTFEYIFITNAAGICPSPTDVTATISN